MEEAFGNNYSPFLVFQLRYTVLLEKMAGPSRLPRNAKESQSDPSHHGLFQQFGYLSIFLFISYSHSQHFKQYSTLLGLYTCIKGERERERGEGVGQGERCHIYFCTYDFLPSQQKSLLVSNHNHNLVFYQIYLFEHFCGISFVTFIQSINKLMSLPP